MKKNLLSIFAMATMLLATGCSQEEEILGVDSNDYVEASFTLDMTDGVQSRTLGEATLIDQLYYGVFQGETPVPVNADQAINDDYVADYVGEAVVTNKTATVKVRLVKGQTYNFVFWAQKNGNTHYTINQSNLKEITVNYNGNANDESRDAFFACLPNHEVKGHFTETVRLYRPFAQVNVGTTMEDFEAAKSLLGDKPVSESKMVVRNIPTTLNLLTGAVSNTVEATFAMAVLPKDADNTANEYDVLEVQNEEYVHLAMNYLLSDVKGQQEVVEVDVEFENENGHINTFTVSQLPIHRNYRTNIIGNILTTEGDFNIIVEPGFLQPDESVDVPWDGESVEKPETDAEGTYVIKTAAEWIWLANNTAWAEGQSVSNIKLANSLDFGGAEIGAITFIGTFDGQGYSIRNAVLTDNDTDARANKPGAGVFGDRTGGTIKNLDLYNVVANVNTASDGWVGAVISAVQNDVQHLSLENVHVYSSDLKGVMSVGGIAGNVMGGAKLTLTNCSVNDTKVGNNLVADKTENGHVAGLVGRVTGTLTINDNVSLNNVDVTGYYSEKRKEASIDAVAAKNVKDNLGTIIGTATTNNVTVNKIPTTASAGNATIASASGMFAFANSVNAGGNNYSGKTVTLAADIDLKNQDWEPIGQTGKTQFNGTFDGGTYTISNLSINSMDQSDEGTYASGLFGWAEVGTFKNITIKGAKVEGGHLCAAVIGYVSGSVKVEYCKVSNAEINCAEQSSDDTDPEGDKAACIVGQVGGGPKTEGYITVSNCSAENSVVKAGRDAGQIVGTATSGNAKYVDTNSCSATNVTVESNNTSTGANINNSIIGRS